MAKSQLAHAVRKAAQPKSAASSETLAVVRTGREGLSPVTGFFGPDVKRQLRILGAELDRTTQDMLAEALNDFFEKYQKPPIVPVGD